MPKIVINQCFGGYGLSEEAYRELGVPWDKYGFEFRNDRANPRLVEVVEKLGSRASGIFSNLSVVDIPEGIEWEIAEYDGAEHVAEKHRTWP